MPWDENDARMRSPYADTPKKCRRWCAVANQILASHPEDEEMAIREANGAIKHGRRHGDSQKDGR